MFTVRIEDSFAAAHFIRHYHGKCENLHGHNYRVRVTASGHTLDEGGMLIDFTILKRSLKSVLDVIDHTNLNDHAFFQEGDPSAERIALYIYRELMKLIPGRPISMIEVFETDKNLAAYIPD